ncbi:MAG: hypothetical protein ACRDMJ_16310 [Solirubrobacteraceae bacterium]
MAPVATGYLARVRAAPAGFDAKVVDGYVRMWLSVPASETVVVLDYRGAPYLRFSRAGVAVNRHSEMFYLNMTPVATVPPATLTARTRAAWSPVSRGHAYEWHDGRLQALASIALAPGTRYVGRWSIPLRVNGRAAAISGGLWHAPRPSPVWFWPIAVILLCVLAGWRLRDDRLDALMAGILGGAATVGMALAAIGLKLHGRPGIAPFHLVELAAILLFAAWAARRVTTRPTGPFAHCTIAIVAIWQGLELMPVLWNGFVLIALPPTLARIAVVACLGAGIALLPVAIRLPGGPEDEEEGDPEADLGPDDPWESELRV